MAQRTIAPAQRYAELFGTALSELPGAGDPAIRRLRETSFDRFRSLGFPGPKVEEWKYTSVAPLTKVEFDLARPPALSRADVEPYLVADPGTTHLVFVNGHFAADLSDIGGSESAANVAPLGAALNDGGDELSDLLLERDPERSFSALNAAFMADGAVIRLPDGGALDGPVQLLFLTLGGERPAMTHPRNLVVLGDGARLDLIECHVALGGSDLTNLVNRVVLGNGAELRHDRLQVGEVSGTFIGKTEYEISADGRLTESLATVGGGLVRNEIQAALDGSGISAQLNGLYLTRERQHVDNAIRIEHMRPNSLSDQFYKGVLDGRARAAFAGKIVVAREAQQTNAYQANDNLLLSPEAEVNTKPELEIFADDVKCSHGATAGELDDRELFYLRSRGLDPALARSLLTYAFADEVLERFASENAAAWARREILRWLPGGEALGELA